MVEKFNKHRTQNIAKPGKGYTSTPTSEMQNKNAFIEDGITNIWG